MQKFFFQANLNVFWACFVCILQLEQLKFGVFIFTCCESTNSRRSLTTIANDKKINIDGFGIWKELINNGV